MSRNSGGKNYSFWGEDISRERRRKYDRMNPPIHSHRTPSKKEISKGDVISQERVKTESITPSKLKSNSILFSKVGQKQRPITYQQEKRNMPLNNSSKVVSSDRGLPKIHKPRDRLKASNSVPTTPFKSKRPVSFQKHERLSVSPSYNRENGSQSASPSSVFLFPSSPNKALKPHSNQDDRECTEKKIDAKILSEDRRTKQLNLLKKIYINKSAEMADDRKHQHIEADSLHRNTVRGKLSLKREDSMNAATLSNTDAFPLNLSDSRTASPFQKNFKPIDRVVGRIGSDANSESSLNDIDLNLLSKARESSLKRPPANQNMAFTRPLKSAKVTKVIGARSDLENLLSSRLENGGNKPEGTISHNIHKRSLNEGTRKKSTISVPKPQIVSSDYHEKQIVMRVPSIHDVLRKSNGGEIKSTANEKKVPIAQFSNLPGNTEAAATATTQNSPAKYSNEESPNIREEDLLSSTRTSPRSSKKKNASVGSIVASGRFQKISPQSDILPHRFTRRQSLNEQLVKKLTSDSRNIITDPVLCQHSSEAPLNNFNAKRGTLTSAAYDSETSTLKDVEENIRRQSGTLVALNDDLSGASSDEAKLQNNGDTCRLAASKKERTIAPTIEQWKHFDKHQFKTLMSSLLINHQPFKYAKTVSCTNNICNVNNYEEADVHELQRLPNRLLYMNLESLDEGLRLNPNEAQQKIIKPRRKEKVKAMVQRRKDALSVAHEEKGFTSREVCHQRTQSDTFVNSTGLEKAAPNSFFGHTCADINAEEEYLPTAVMTTLGDTHQKEGKQDSENINLPFPGDNCPKEKTQDSSLGAEKSSRIQSLEKLGFAELETTSDSNALRKFFDKIMGVMRSCVVNENNSDLLNAESVIENLAGEIMKSELQIATLVGKNAAYQKQVSEMANLQSKLLNDLSSSTLNSEFTRDGSSSTKDHTSKNSESEIFQKLADRIEQNLRNMDSMERTVARKLEDIKHIKDTEVKDHPLVKSLEETILRNKEKYESQLKSERLRVHNLKAALLIPNGSSSQNENKMEAGFEQNISEVRKPLEIALKSVVAKEQLCEQLRNRCNEYEKIIEVREKECKDAREEVKKERKMQEDLKKEQAQSIMKLEELHKSQKRLQAKVIDLERVKRDFSSINSLKKQVNELNTTKKKKNSEISDLKKEVQNLQRAAVSSKPNEVQSAIHSSTVEALQRVEESLNGIEKQLVGIRSKLSQNGKQNEHQLDNNGPEYDGKLGSGFADDLFDLDARMLAFHDERAAVTEKISRLTRLNRFNENVEDAKNIKLMHSCRTVARNLKSEDKLPKEKQDGLKSEIARAEELNISLSTKLLSSQDENTALKKKIKSLQDLAKKNSVLDKTENPKTEGSKKKFQFSNDQLQATILRLVKEKQSLLAKVMRLEHEKDELPEG